MKFYWTYGQKIKHRRPYYQRLAKKLGLLYQEKDTDRFHIFLKDIKIFKRGRPKRHINNIIFREFEEPDEHHYFFDYHYVVSSGNSTRIFDQTVLFVQTKKLSLPEFHLKPKNAFNRIAEFFGKKRADLENEYLNNKYILYTESPHVLKWLQSDAILNILKRQPKMEIFGSNYQLVLYRHNKLAPVEKLESTYQDYFQLYELIEQLEQE